MTSPCWSVKEEFKKIGLFFVSVGKVWAGDQREAYTNSMHIGFKS